MIRLFQKNIAIYFSLVREHTCLPSNVQGYWYMYIVIMSSTSYQACEHDADAAFVVGLDVAVGQT